MKNRVIFKMPDLSKYIRRLDSLGGNLVKATEDVLLQAAETVQEDVREAVTNANLPAHGKYSTGKTMEAIVPPQVNTDGYVFTVPLGFDFSKGGAGGWLITGTPRMQPDQKLHRIFKEKKYMNNLEKDLIDTVMDYIEEAMK